MADLDPKLLARFRADPAIDQYFDSESDFVHSVDKDLARLRRARKRTTTALLTLGFILFMAILAFALLGLSRISLIGETPNFANNLTMPFGALVLFGWVLFRKVRRRI